MPSIPSASVLRWAEKVLGREANVTVERSLHGSVSPWLLRVQQDGSTYPVVMRIPVPGRIAPAGIIMNAEALILAERHNVPSPRLLACDRAGDEAGETVSLETGLPGMSDFPDDLDPEQIRNVGIAMAKVHAIRLEPRRWLSPRSRPIQPDDYARDRRWAALYQTTAEDHDDVLSAYLQITEFPPDDPRAMLSHMQSTPLLLMADDIVRAYKQTDEPTVLLHGDLWPGNTRWNDGRFTALIDWKTAGVGNPGVDLGSMRLQVALRYGPTAATFVLEGWERQMERQATDIAYWDAVAALNTPTIMEGWPDCDPISHPLGARAVTRRRDAFLNVAIGKIR